VATPSCVSRGGWLDHRPTRVHCCPRPIGRPSGHLVPALAYEYLAEKIKHPVPAKRAGVRAEITAEFVDRLARAAGMASRPRTGRTESGTKDENAPPTTAGRLLA
jgi:hypothetical protein